MTHAYTPFGEGLIPPPAGGSLLPWRIYSLCFYIKFCESEGSRFLFSSPAFLLRACPRTFVVVFPVTCGQRGVQSAKRVRNAPTDTGIRDPLTHSSAEGRGWMQTRLQKAPGQRAEELVRSRSRAAGAEGRRVASALPPPATPRPAPALGGQEVCVDLGLRSRGWGSIYSRGYGSIENHYSVFLLCFFFFLIPTLRFRCLLTYLIPRTIVFVVVACTQL